MASRCFIQDCKEEAIMVVRLVEESPDEEKFICPKHVYLFCKAFMGLVGSVMAQDLLEDIELATSKNKIKA